MLNLKKITRKTSRIFASLVLMTAQMTPFFVFSGAKASALDTGFKVPTSTHTPNDWDVNTVANVQTSNDVPVVLYASDNDGQEQGYSNFNFPAIPANSTIDGVEVVVEAKSTDSGNDCQVRVNLSWNNGTNYTTAIDATIDDTEGVDTLGGSNNNWGRTWSVGDFTNANFVLKIQDRDPGNQCTDDATTSVDQIQAKVYYTEPVPKPDLTIVKTNNVGNNVVVNGTFVWTLLATNNGPGSVSFDNQNIILDELPTSGATYSLGSVTTAGGVTGTVDCNISSNTLDCDDNNNGSVVFIPSGGSIAVPINVTATSVGSLVNPRNGGTCKVDPDNLKSELLENNNSCVNNSVTVTEVPITANPALVQACGLDIAFVLDVSGSINSTELSQLKTAMTGVVTALDGTPTEYSVTKFDTNANVVQTFSGNTSTITTAINGISGGGSTNWQDAFIKGQSTLFNRPDHPDLLIFASDGNPNTIGSPGASATESVSVSAAKVVANAIKAGGTRILSIGIGTDLNLANMQAVSGPNTNTGSFTTSDVISTSFDTLATQLAAFASQTCGGTVTVTKLIDADGDNATTNDQTPATGWTFDINGGSNPSATQTSGAQGQTPAVAVTPASGYSVNETPQDGFEIQSASCTGASNVGTFSGNSITGMTINANNVVTCTFINRRMPPKLTLIKSVNNNNGGNAQPNDFNLKIDGQAVQSGVENTVSAGAHTINETQLSGYSFVSITGDPKCPQILGGTITLALGDNVTCTITNDDIAPVLWLEKSVVNDNGGTLTADDFGIQIAGLSPVVFGENGVVNGPMKTYKSGSTLSSNVEYVVSENNTEGYSEGSWVCKNAQGNTVANGQFSQVKVTMNEGDIVTCSITNDDTSPQLTLIKLVTKDNGGTEIASAWTLIAQAGAQQPVINENGAIVPSTNSLKAATAPVPVTAGIFYTLSETGPTGYLASNWSCDGGTQINNTIKLVLASSITCTITNDDIAPSLTLNKVLIKDNGGVASENNWTLTATGPTNISGAGAVGDTDVVSGPTFKAGTYTLAEAGGPTGYSASPWTCTNGVAVNGQNQITLVNGKTTVCSITNDDIQPKLTLVKTVINDNSGDKVADDFNLSVTKSTKVYVQSGVSTSFDADNYTVGEEQLDGYSASNWTGDCESNGTITLSVGGEYTCYITNNDIAHPSINVKKSGPSTAQAGQKVTYTFTVTNTGDVSLEVLKVLDNITGAGVYVSGDTNLNNVLEVTETWIYKGEYTIPASQTANVVNTVKVCSYEKQQLEYSDNARVNSLIIIDERDSICDDDTHTLTIPAVLGSSTTVKVTPAPVKLVSTGSNQYLAIISGISFVVIVSWLTKKSYEDK